MRSFHSSIVVGIACAAAVLARQAPADIVSFSFSNEASVEYLGETLNDPLSGTDPTLPLESTSLASIPEANISSQSLLFVPDGLTVEHDFLYTHPGVSQSRADVTASTYPFSVDQEIGYVIYGGLSHTADSQNLANLTVTLIGTDPDNVEHTLFAQSVSDDSGLGALELSGDATGILEPGWMYEFRSQSSLYSGFGESLISDSGSGMTSLLLLPLGVCCLPDESCLRLTEEHCAALSGVYRGDGSTCADAPCGSQESCQVSCPADVTIACGQSTDPSSTGAGACSDGSTPTYSDSIALGSCPAVSIITRTWTCTCNGVQTSCQQIITVQDDTPPAITCPSDITVDHDAGRCCAVVTFAVTATDDCTPSPTVVCYDQRGNVVNSGDCFPVGTTTVTCTAVDACGNTSQCAFQVNVLGSICGVKFYDRNGDGRQDESEPSIAGWKVQLLDSAGNVRDTQFTDEAGFYCFRVMPGNYQVCEAFPSSNWGSFTPICRPVTISPEICDELVDFGNFCKTAPGVGVTLGYWSNKNGQAILRADDGDAPAGWRALLNTLGPNGTTVLVMNLHGDRFTVAPKPPYDFNTAYTGATRILGFRPWLLGADAKNMAYMLSAQLAATELNVRETALGRLPGGLSASQGLLIPDALIVAGVHVVATLNANGLVLPRTTTPVDYSYITLGDLMSRAIASLAANPNTLASGPARTYQDCLKTLLDIVNNSNNPGGQMPGIPANPLIYVAGAPGAFESPY